MKITTKEEVLNGGLDQYPILKEIFDDPSVKLIRWNFLAKDIEVFQNGYWRQRRLQDYVEKPELQGKLVDKKC